MEHGNHTPGPWRKTTGFVADGEHRVIAQYTGSRESLLRWVTPGSTEAEANGRLIAAAPDLLAACEAALQWAVNGCDDESLPFIKMLRAAVAKATGRESSP